MLSRDPEPVRTRQRRQREPLPALGYLKGSDLWSTWERLAALGRDLAALQPNLPLVPLKLDKQILVVTARSAALAARVRQFEPRLIEGLRARGWLLNRIRFRPIGSTLANEEAATRPVPREKAPVSGNVLDRCQSLVESDPDLPAELRGALGDFVRRQRGYRAD